MKVGRGKASSPYFDKGAYDGAHHAVDEAVGAYEKGELVAFDVPASEGDMAFMKGDVGMLFAKAFTVMKS